MLVAFLLPGATGSIQTSTRTYASAATYTYDGSANQVTGNGLPATTVGALTINNTGCQRKQYCLL